MAQSSEEQNKAWARIIARSWSDPKFKQRLMEDPNGTLEAEGISIPSGMHFEVHEDSQEMHHLTLPQKPSEELSEDQLENIAGGVFGAFGTISASGIASEEE